MNSLIWGPTIDAASCDGCRTCLEFCRQGVYSWEDDTVRVVHREACITGCSHCASLCPRGAIAFPDLAEFKRSRAEAK